MDLREKLIELLDWIDYNNAGNTNSEIADNFIKQTNSINCALNETQAVRQNEQLQEVSLSSEVFSLANKLAINGYGDQAVLMHSIHNNLIETE